MEKRFDQEVEQRNEFFFIIVLARVLQLCVHVLSRIMKDQSIVVRLEKYCVFVVFNFEKISTHRGRRKVYLKKSQCIRAEKMLFM